MKNIRRTTALLLLFAALFCAALAGSVYCGLLLTRPGVDAAAHAHLRNLIYFHFALTQLALLGGLIVFYLRHRRWKRYYLVVSYNEKGLLLNPPGIRMPAERVYRCHLGNIAAAELPQTQSPVLVYPLFMQSGSSSGRKLVHALQAAYAARGTNAPRLYFQPVLGASPWLAEAAADYLRPRLAAAGSGVLVVAHGSRLPEPPPEPALFCRRLRELLPGAEVCLGYFNQEPEARAVLPAMQAQHVLVLPFLLTEGVHTQRDLPTAAHAAACGKTLERLPVAAALLPDTAEAPES